MSSPTFDRFAELPTELRLEIWRARVEGALNPPRAIICDPLWRPRNLENLLQSNGEAHRETLSRTDLRCFHRPPLPALLYPQISSPTHDWFSVLTDIFVLPDDNRCLSEEFHANSALRDAIQTIAFQRMCYMERESPNCEN